MSIESQKVLKIIREQSPLGNKSIQQIRADFEKFYLQFSSRQNLNVEDVSINSVPGFRIAYPGACEENIILFFHGGGFTIGSTKDHLDLCGKISQASGAIVLSIDYRLAPEHVFPAALEDCISSYNWLREQGIDSSRIIISGISAGGTLALSTLIYLRDKGIPMPGVAVCLSPAVDMMFPAESVERNREKDWINKQRLDALRNAYLPGTDPEQPLASPVNASLEGLPPLFIQAGTHELLIDDIKRFSEKAEKAGVNVTLDLWSDMFHCWQIFSNILPEGLDAIERVGGYIKKKLTNL